MTQALVQRDDRAPFDAVLLYVFTGAAAFAALLAAAFTRRRVAGRFLTQTASQSGNSSRRAASSVA